MPKLVIAEKPSVAQSLARVIGAGHRKDGYLEGNGYIVSWCIGHLVELAPPEHYHENYAKWRYEDLPILPQFTDQGWKYLVSESTGKQFGVLKKLMNRSDVDVIILATDAGREGELIGRLVYHQCNCRKPMERLWILSMEDEAIRDGFHHIKPSTEYDALYEAALCRERADWIVGINATRLFSCLYRQTLQVGRVMTPTLAMVVLRDAEIAAFQSEPFYTVLVGTDTFTGVSERMKNKDDALALLAHCKDAGMIRVLDVEYKEKSEKAPALYDLTSLQRDANRTLGYTAQQTLDYAQSLYEKKLITYPRTDSRYLTEDMASALPDWIREVAHIFAIQGRDCSDAITKGQKNIHQVINDKKVSDHHAIIPTRSCKNTVLTSLPAGERQILTLIAARFVAAAADPYRYKETIATLDCGGHAFSVKGKTVLQEGWKSVEGLLIHKKEEKNEERTLPGFVKGMEFRLVDAELKEGKTTPPKKFTEDTLLSAMESAGAEDQESLKGIASSTFNSSTFNPSGDNSLGQVEHKGLGTPATRAGIIEKLVRTGLIKRQGDKKTRYLTSTDKGNALITVMPEQIQSPSMTADWEMKLHRMEHGSYDPEEFMGEITDMITELVRNYQVVEGTDVLMNQKTVIGICPHCGHEIVDGKKGWYCNNKECRFILWKDNAFFKSLGKNLTTSMAEKFLKDRQIYLKNCTSRKSDRTFNATVLLRTESDGKVTFDLKFPESGKKKSSQGGKNPEGDDD